jgi:hypothetical protein
VVLVFGCVRVVVYVMLACCVVLTGWLRLTMLGAERRIPQMQSSDDLLVQGKRKSVKRSKRKPMAD